VNIDKPILFDETGAAVSIEGALISPNALNMASVFTNSNKMYPHTWDEAMRDAPLNALAMMRDPFYRSLIQERTAPTINLEWQVQAVDEQDPIAKLDAEIMNRAWQEMPDKTGLVTWLLQAGVWFGRCAQQGVWGRSRSGLHNWIFHEPVHGDSLQFQWDNTPVLLVSQQSAQRYRASDPEAVVTSTFRGAFGLRLHKPEYRNRFIIHKHVREASDYFEGEMAGGVHGVGLRSWVYWADYQRRDALEAMIGFMRSTGMMDLIVFNFPHGDSAAESRAKTNAKKVSGKIALICPRDPVGNWQAIETYPMNTTGVEVVRGLIEEYYDRYIRELFVGQSMSNGGGGPGGLEGDGRAELAGDTKFQLCKSDAKRLAESLTNDWLYPCLRYNRPDSTSALHMVPMLDDPKAEKKVQNAQILINSGVEIEEEELRTAAGFRTPREGKPTVGKKEPMPQPGAMPGQQPGGESGRATSQEQPKDLGSIAELFSVLNRAKELIATTYGFDPNQPRDDDGKFADEGKGKAGNPKKATKKPFAAVEKLRDDEQDAEAKDYLDTAIWNATDADGKPDPAKMRRELAFHFRAATEQKKSASVEALKKALAAMDCELVGEPGKETEFSGALHHAKQGMFTGDRVKIVRPAVVFNDKNGRRVLEKAEVESYSLNYDSNESAPGIYPPNANRKSWKVVPAGGGDPWYSPTKPTANDAQKTEHPKAESGKPTAKSGRATSLEPASATARKAIESVAGKKKDSVVKGVKKAKVDVARRRRILRAHRVEAEVAKSVSGVQLPDSEPADVVVLFDASGKIVNQGWKENGREYTPAQVVRQSMRSRRMAVERFNQLVERWNDEIDQDSDEGKRIRAQIEEIGDGLDKTPLYFVEVKNLQKSHKNSISMTAKALKRKELWAERYSGRFITYIVDDRKGAKYSGNRVYMFNGVKKTVRLSECEKLPDMPKLSKGEKTAKDRKPYEAFAWVTTYEAGQPVKVRKTLTAPEAILYDASDIPGVYPPTESRKTWKVVPKGGGKPWYSDTQPQPGAESAPPPKEGESGRATKKLEPQAIADILANDEGVNRVMEATREIVERTAKISESVSTLNKTTNEQFDEIKRLENGRKTEKSAEKRKEMFDREQVVRAEWYDGFTKLKQLRDELDNANKELHAKIAEAIGGNDKPIPTEFRKTEKSGLDKALGISNLKVSVESKEVIETATNFVASVTAHWASPTVQFAKSKDDRAFAHYENGIAVVALGKIDKIPELMRIDKATAVHELGHIIEMTKPGVRKLAQVFAEHRFGDEEPRDMHEVSPAYAKGA
jgi:hypothetical protein